MAVRKIDGIAVRRIQCLIGADQHDHRAASGPLTEADLVKVSSFTGIRTRRTFSDIRVSRHFVHAAKLALARSGIQRSQLECLIVVGQVGDYTIPGTAHLVHAALGLAPTTFCYDINLGCSGFVFGIAVGAGHLQAGSGKACLVLAGDALSRFIDPADRATAPIFGDAVSATVLQRDTGAKPIYVLLESYGSLHESLILDRPSAEDPEPYLNMAGMDVFRFVTASVPAAVTRLLSWARVDIDSVDHFVPHQANGLIVDYLGRRLGFEGQRLVKACDGFGNTSGASIPLAIAQRGVSESTGHFDGRALLVGFGTGMSLAAGLIDFCGTGVDIATEVAIGER